MRAALALLFVMGCGGAASESPGRTTTEGASESRPIELTLRTVDGAFYEIGELRGGTVLLYFFATFDGVSQAGLDPLGRFATAHDGELTIVGVAIQPEARELLDAYVHALAPPFVATYDPDDRVTQGATDLERVVTVPTYVMIDARGVEVARHEGLANVRTLEALYARVADRGSPVVQQPPPLLGTPR